MRKVQDKDVDQNGEKNNEKYMQGWKKENSG